MAAASSLLLANSVPVWVFLFFCRNGQYERKGEERGIRRTELPAFFKALARSLSRWLPRVMLFIVLSPEYQKTVWGREMFRERKSLEGSAFRRITGGPPIYGVLHYKHPLDILDSLIEVLEYQDISLFFILTHLIGDYVLAVIGPYSYLVSTLAFYFTLALRIKAHSLPTMYCALQTSYQIYLDTHMI